MYTSGKTTEMCKEDFQNKLKSNKNSALDTLEAIKLFSDCKERRTENINKMINRHK